MAGIGALYMEIGICWPVVFHNHAVIELDLPLLIICQLYVIILTRLSEVLRHGATKIAALITAVNVKKTCCLSEREIRDRLH